MLSSDLWLARVCNVYIYVSVCVFLCVCACGSRAISCLLSLNIYKRQGSRDPIPFPVLKLLNIYPEFVESMTRVRKKKGLQVPISNKDRGQLNFVEHR